MSARAVVITVSDRVSRGEREDRSGPLAVQALRDAGHPCDDPVVVPDGVDTVRQALREAVATGARLVITTGGTGISPRDLTPEGTAPVLTREVPGIAQEIRRVATTEKPGGMLSRGLSGIVDGEHGGTLVVNLPGSSAAIGSAMPIVLSVAGHVLGQLDGQDH